MNLSTLKHGDILWCKGIPSVVINATPACYVDHAAGIFTATVTVYNRGEIKELIFEGEEKDCWDDWCYKGISLICNEETVKIRTLWENITIPSFDKMIEDETDSIN